MAKKDKDSVTERPGARTFKPDTSRFVSIPANSSHTGIFIGAVTVQITDKRTHRPKDLFVLKLRNEETGQVDKLPCAAMMKRGWEDMVDEYGNGDEQATIEYLRGKVMTIERGDDAETSSGDEMGSYSMTVYEK